jgi:uroporphyrinogen III methyltransferase/synthase
MTVYLVGAGPGDPGLLTVRGAEVLARADVVVHDRLAGAPLLELAPPGAERIDVGKRPGSPPRQDEVNALLVDRARAGLEVVRLKGGDPFVFGRGGEEAQALSQAGVDFEIVPGVSAATAVPAYAGVPVTHRGLATSFTVVTGHSASAPESEVDWDALGRAGGTVVVLMGVAHRADIAKRLVGAGRSPDTPVLAVSHGTRPAQRSVRTTLEGLGAAEIDTPATIVIGPVAGLDLAWFERKPLLGRKIVVTRARPQAPALSGPLRELGAEPVEAPVVEISPPADGGAALGEAAARIGSYEWVVLTSANAVGPLFEQLRDARSLGAARVAAIGPGTAEALRARGVEADLVPDRFVAESLLGAMPASAREGARVLLPRAAGARDVLPDGLRERGWQVDVVEAYRTTGAALPPPVVDEVAAADAVTFTSSSTVRAFIDAVGAGAVPPVVACIGPVTASTACESGLEVTVVAEVHTIRGLLDALAGHFARTAAG